MSVNHCHCLSSAPSLKASSDFYREDRPYLKTLCRRLQAFCESDRKVLVVNMPPRHGKSRTAVLLSQWLFGRDPSEQIMTGSYNETLSTTFARAVRDGMPHNFLVVCNVSIIMFC